MTSIELHQVSKTYPGQRQPAIRDVSLTVQSGELLALLGPSGSGKSTILKLIAGIEQPDAGDLRLDGQSILALPANRRGAVLMFQKAYLFPFMRVADNIGFGLKLQRLPPEQIRAAVAQMLELVELPGIEARYPAQLSGGEQQRVALARALVTRPRVLLLDEPLSSLDTSVRHTLQEAIRRIQRELGITTLLVTHDLSEAIVMADRIALLLDQRIAACARPECLFQRPATRAVARFVGVSTFLDGQVAGDLFGTAWGTLQVLPVDGPPRPATFAIRPEHLRLHSQPVPNALPGMVADWLYKGEYSEYQLRIGSEIVRVRAEASAQRYAPGTALYVEFPADKLFEVS